MATELTTGRESALDKTVLLVGTLDTKGAEFAFVRTQILQQGIGVLTLNAGVFPVAESLPVDIASDEVAHAGGGSITALRAGRDRALAIQTMADGAARIARRLFDAGRIAAVLGMGGSGGTTVATAAMRALPIGVPKVCVSTLASGDVSHYVGTRDVTMMPAITDVAGLNPISQLILARAAGAICGMLQCEPLQESIAQRPIIAASMFGNTTRCVDACREALSDEGFEVFVFHSTGTGGRTMEGLIDDGFVAACLDITTTEWADELCGGILSAGPDRLSAAGRRGIPHLIVPGCLDMVNFGPLESVPEHYRAAGRLFYPWNPQVTLMRTNVAENRRLGEIIAEKANAATGPVAFLLPLRGVSIVDGDGEPFCDREADRALFDALRQHLRVDIPVVELDANINDAQFARRAVEMLLSLIRRQPAVPPVPSVTH